MDRAERISAILDHLIEKAGGEAANLVVFFPHKAEFGPVRKGPLPGTYIQTTFFKTPDNKDIKPANVYFTAETVGVVYEPIESKIIAPEGSIL